MEDVIVAGYPKSGNTWITRLAAEILACPVEGFWNEPNNDEPLREGLGRVADIRCFKSHHRLCEL